MPVATPEQIALVTQNLPADAVKPEADGGYGWTDVYISDLLEGMDFSPAKVVRFFWLQRVNETAEYIDIGKPLTQIHKQAKDMLAYWDNILSTNPGELEPAVTAKVKRPISFGEIERPWQEEMA